MAANIPLLVGAVVAGAVVIDFGVKVAKAQIESANAGSAPAASAPAGNDAKSIRDWLEGQGLTKNAAAGIVGNLQQESNLDPHAPGGGLAQWIGSRWNALLGFAAAHGQDPHSVQGQLAYLMHELQTQYPGLIGQLNAAGSPGEAATIFSNQYERPGIPMLSNRVNYANQAAAA